jgi:hypothetical protein
MNCWLRPIYAICQFPTNCSFSGMKKASLGTWNEMVIEGLIIEFPVDGWSAESPLAISTATTVAPLLLMSSIV